MIKITSLALLGTLALVSLAPFASAHEGHTHTGTTTIMTAEQLTCVRTAVSAREKSIRTGYVTLSTSLLASLDKRALALDAAWMIADKTARTTARDTAWTTWNTDAKSARDLWKTARKNAWDTSRTSIKACKVNPSTVESSRAQGSDVQ